MSPRSAEIVRHTNETRIRVVLGLDGSGMSRIASGIGFLDHMLEQIARHGLFDLTVEAEGDLHIDAHHTVEDIGISLGQACAQAAGDKKGLRRYGHAYVPLDEALTRVVVDLSGRPRVARAVHARADRYLRRRPGARILPGLRQPRAAHLACRYAAWCERPPSMRDRLQGIRARVALRTRARRTGRRGDSQHQGQLVSGCTAAIAARR